MKPRLILSPHRNYSFSSANNEMSTAIQTPADVKDRVARFRDTHSAIKREVRKVIVGQEEVVEHLLISLFVGGHCLLTGLPGTAKTLLVRTVARALGLQFNRIQFTPDLMPSDITGTDIIEEDPTTGRRVWTFVPGPIFANVLLADEINRTPPKTQSALLEAMQEASCTVRGNHYRITPPFIVLATQNPIELEGTYPLPEAQLDRFLFNSVLDYLTAEDELKVVDLTTTTSLPQAETVTTAEDILEYQNLIRMTPVAESVARYAVDLVRATRPTSSDAPDFIKKYVNFGASVRAVQFLVLASKARALMNGRFHVSYDDLRALAAPVLRHRVLLNFHAESDRVTTDEIVRRLLGLESCSAGVGDLPHAGNRTKPFSGSSGARRTLESQPDRAHGCGRLCRGPSPLARFRVQPGVC